LSCVECGKESLYWLCSNACAIAYAKTRGRRECAVCSYDPKTGRVGRHDTTRLCAECVKRSENAEWLHRQDERVSQLFEEEVDAALARLSEEQDRPLPEVTALTRRIAYLVIEGEQVPFEYRDPKGVKRGIRYRWRAYTLRRLAKKVGCTQAQVQRIIASIES